MLRSLGSEVSLLCSAALRAHPHVIACHGCALCPGPPARLALVTELMDCDLYDYIHRRRQVGGLHMHTWFCSAATQVDG